MVATWRWHIWTLYFTNFGDIFIMGDLPTQPTQLSFIHFKLTLSGAVVIILHWFLFRPWFLFCSISACHYLQQQYEEPHQDTAYYALAEFFWGSHFCGRSGRLTKRYFLFASVSKFFMCKPSRPANKKWRTYFDWFVSVSIEIRESLCCGFGERIYEILFCRSNRKKILHVRIA